MCRALCFLMLFWPTVAIGQTANSEAAYRFAAEASNRQIASQIAYRDSKKISILSLGDYPKEPRESVSVDQLSVGVPAYIEYWQFHVMSIIDDQNVILRVGDTSLWLTGYQTENLVDKDEVRVLGLVIPVQPRTYTAVTGSRKKVACVKLATKEQNEERKKDQELKFLDENFPIWTLKNGKEFRAKFLTNSGIRIKFQSPAGEKMQHTLRELSDESANLAR